MKHNKRKKKHKVCKENFYLLKLLDDFHDLTYEQYVAFCEEDPACCDLCSPTRESPIGRDYIDNFMFDVPYYPTRQKYLREMIRIAKYWLGEIQKKSSPDFNLAAVD